MPTGLIAAGAGVGYGGGRRPPKKSPKKPVRKLGVAPLSGAFVGATFKPKPAGKIGAGGAAGATTKPRSIHPVKKTPAAPAAPKPQAPVVGAGSSTYAPSVAAGQAAGTATKTAAPATKAAAAAKTVDPIDKLYQPALDALKASRDKATAMGADMEANLAAFRQWQAAQSGAAESALKQRFDEISAQRKAAVDATNQALGQYITQARQASGLEADGLKSAGVDAVAQVGALRADSQTASQIANDQLAAALTQRQVDTRRVDTAGQANLLTQLQMLKQKKTNDLDKQDTDLKLTIAKAKQQAAADAATAAALGAKNQADIQFKYDQLNSNNAAKQQRLALDRQRLASENEWKAVSAKMAAAAAKATKDKDAKSRWNSIYKTVVAERTRAEKVWGQTTGIDRAKAMQQEITRQAEVLRSAYPDASAAEIVKALNVVWGKSTVATASTDWAGVANGALGALRKIFG